MSDSAKNIQSKKVPDYFSFNTFCPNRKIILEDVKVLTDHCFPNRIHFAPAVNGYHSIDSTRKQ